jgi:hypothetical protein
MSSVQRYKYYEYDGSLFRARADSGLVAVDDIWQGGAWVPYKGSDPQRPVFYGELLETNPVADD